MQILFYKAKLCNISFFYVSRYNPQTAAEKRIKRMPSCRRQETSKEIDLVGKTAGVVR